MTGPGAGRLLRRPAAVTTGTGLGRGAGVALLRRGWSRVVGGGWDFSTEARREVVRVAVRGEDGWTGSCGGGSAGPFKVKETRRGRDEVAVDVAMLLGVVTGLGFSGAGMTGVAGVAGLDLRVVDLGGDGAGAASGTVVVTVSVVTAIGAGRGCSVLRFFEDVFTGEVAVSAGLGSAGLDSAGFEEMSDLGVSSSRFLFFEEDLLWSFGLSLCAFFTLNGSLGIEKVVVNRGLGIAGIAGIAGVDGGLENSSLNVLPRLPNF